MSQDFRRYQQGLTSSRGFKEILYLKEEVSTIKKEKYRASKDRKDRYTLLSNIAFQSCAIHLLKRY